MLPRETLAFPDQIPRLLNQPEQIDSVGNIFSGYDRSVLIKNGEASHR
jgi:hypothetical protein